MLIIATYHPFGRLSHGGEVAIGGVRFFEGDAEQNFDRARSLSRWRKAAGVARHCRKILVRTHTPAPAHETVPSNRQNATSAT